jgi:deoxyinosine 3'endonuclease (endonuclease V)
MLHAGVLCRCGSASHLGVQCGVPTVGVGKTLLCQDGLRERHVRETLGHALQALKDHHALPPGCHTQQTHRGETVVCMELKGEESGEVLGMAVAGMHGSQRPIYISRGAFMLYFAVNFVVVH